MAKKSCRWVCCSSLFHTFESILLLLLLRHHHPMILLLLGCSFSVSYQSRALSNNEVARSTKTNRKSPEIRRNRERLPQRDGPSVLPVALSASRADDISDQHVAPPHHHGHGLGFGSASPPLCFPLCPATIAIATDFYYLQQTWNPRLQLRCRFGVKVADKCLSCLAATVAASAESFMPAE